MLKEKYAKIKDAMIEKYGKDKGETIFSAWVKKENVDVEAKSFNFITSVLELKSENDVDVVEGWFSVGEPDSYNDIVTEECMEGMVSQLKALPITIDDNHESFKDKGFGERFKSLNPIAKVVDAELKGNRVWVKTVLNKAHSKYEEYKSSIKNGFLHSFSFAFIPTKSEYKSIEGVKHRLLRAVNLLNGCFTGVPVHREATFSNVALKSLSEVDYDEEEVKSLLEELNVMEELKHKYVKRTGSPGDYTYFYADGSSSKKNGKSDGSSKQGEMKKEVDELVSSFGEIDASDLQGVTEALAKKYGVDADDLYSYVTEKGHDAAIRKSNKNQKHIEKVYGKDKADYELKKEKEKMPQKDKERFYDSAMEEILDGNTNPNKIADNLDKSLNKQSDYSKELLVDIAKEALSDEKKIARKNPEASPLGKPKVEKKSDFYNLMEELEMIEEVKSLTDKVSVLEKELAELKAEEKAEDEVKDDSEEEKKEVEEESKEEPKEEGEPVKDSEEVKALKERIDVLEKTINEPQYKAIVEKKSVSKTEEEKEEEVKSKAKGPIDLIN